MSAVDTRELAQSPWVERLGRVGLVAKGVLYGIVGAIALAIPLGVGGRPEDREGALRSVASVPFGEMLLLALGTGFAGYAIWRFVQAFLDRDGDGKGLKGLAKRIGYLGRGLLYAVSAFIAFSIVGGLGSGGSNERQETAKVLDLPLGRWIVGAVGAGFLAAGAYNLYRSLTGKFRKHLHEEEMCGTERGWTIVVGVIGHAARAVVFALIGLFLARAAWQYDPREAIGIDGALQKVSSQPYGGALLAAVATGLIAYGLYCLVQARYREV